MTEHKKAPVFRAAFLASLPVMAGYIVLGIGFGMVLRASGYGLGWAFGMSAFIYAGSMQYAAVELLSAGAPLLTAALTAAAVNARHIFYGISMLERYRGRKGKAFLVFTLTDETYSLVCSDAPVGEGRARYDLCISALDYVYWVAGSVLGSALGSVLPFSTEGIDFALTALFLTVFTEQWLMVKDHRPALIGAGLSLAALLIFGSGRFLIPAMLGITAALLLLRRREVRRA